VKGPILKPKVVISTGVGLLALVVLLYSTGPNPETEFSGSIRRMGGPCLTLDQWGLFGWTTIGQTASMTQATTGKWQLPSDDLGCDDVDDSLILVRMPIGSMQFVQTDLAERLLGIAAPQFQIHEPERAEQTADTSHA
jgi:hypothetical protein